ncbi:alpha/beta fold hydrolase [Haloactinomyces albus]|uniref:Pimeloyl-ACP methyl ester carboxylesterase n=1 Tax=Haloactinomyces albus TaxID=1352928 RepID=A0AAE3ZC08_9ACTN|nr:alpha/beta fold hydrolase [Haloactinomyces albus]MDR7301110.1 pimeloyl-ACP methyl ester carboxylesterase [Haloactinomyces albus]
MHYIESGVGPPLVLLHAFPVDARMWHGTRALLEGQARVITPDQRGLGQSPLDGSSAPNLADEGATRRAAEQPDLETVATDVIALLDGLDLSEVVLGGCSMGGYVAMAVLRAAPERVAGLLLADTKTIADNEDQRANRRNVADRAEAEGTAGWLAENSLPGLVSRTTRHERPGVVDEIGTLIDEQPAEGVAWAQRAMAARPDSTGTLRGFTGPALVVVGEEDAITPPETARDVTAVLPHSELVTLPGAGHLSAMETPEAFANAVLPWLDRIG